MNNTEQKSSSKIITDPEKLKKHIKFSGKFAVCWGGFLLFFMFIVYVSVIPNYSGEDFNFHVSSLLIPFFAVAYILSGIMIIRNPIKAKTPSYILIGLSIVSALPFGLFGFVLLGPAWFGYQALGYIKKLEAQAH